MIRNTHRVLLALTAVAFLLVGAPASNASAETVDRIIAIVDDEVITFQELREEGRLALLRSGQSLEMLDQAPNRSQQLQQLLETVVQTRLLVHEANRQQIRVGDDQVDARLQMIYEATNLDEVTYRKQMQERGISWALFRRSIANELKVQSVIRAELGGQANVSKADIEACAKSAEPFGPEKPKLTIQQILVHADPFDEFRRKSGTSRTLYPAYWNAVDQARYSAARILYTMVTEEGLPFEQTASRYSAGRSRERGGHLGEYAPGDLQGEFAKVFELAEGEVSDILETEAGFHILRAEKIEMVENEGWPQALDKCRGDLINAESMKLLNGYVQSLSDSHFVEIKLTDDIAKTVEE